MKISLYQYGCTDYKKSGYSPLSFIVNLASLSHWTLYNAFFSSVAALSSTMNEFVIWFCFLNQISAATAIDTKSIALIVIIF